MPPGGPFGGGAPPPRAAAARRRAAAQRPPVFFELGPFSWCGSCRAPRELENPSSLSFQLVRVAENGPRVRFPSFPNLPDEDCSGLTQKQGPNMQAISPENSRTWPLLSKIYGVLAGGEIHYLSAPALPFKRVRHTVCRFFVAFQNF